MVIVHIRQGLGNQLFQYAFGRCLAYKLNTELKLDITECQKDVSTQHRYYQLGNFNIKENFATAEEIASVNEKDWKILKNGLLPINQGDNVFIHGHWMQSEPYFLAIGNIIREEFTLKKPLTNISATWKEKILSSDCAVSLHIRLGDYFLPSIRSSHWGRILPFDYYNNCVKELKKIAPSLKLFIFSNDLDWVRKNFKFDVPTEFVEGCEFNYEELYLMSLCQHNIIANSSFAWWGAWLNQNPNKKVLIPHFCAQMTNSIKIPVDGTKRPLVELPPMLSIIVYVENNVSTINVTLMSLLSQNFKDYEIIFLDASLDGSGKICRQMANDIKVNVLTVSRFINKTAAWNKGLEMASGDYTLFLSGQDFLFTNTLNHISDFYTQAYDQNFNKRNQNPAYENFVTLSKYTPNIVCSTQYLEEDEGGTINLNGIPNKTFSVKVDPSFQNLNGTAELSIPANQKLIALGTNGIDSSISTKFFKRKFLIDNDIRFQEGGYRLRTSFPHQCIFVYGKNYIRTTSFYWTA